MKYVPLLVCHVHQDGQSECSLSSSLSCLEVLRLNVGPIRTNSVDKRIPVKPRTRCVEGRKTDSESHCGITQVLGKATCSVNSKGASRAGLSLCHGCWCAFFFLVEPRFFCRSECIHMLRGIRVPSIVSKCDPWRL